MPGQGGFRLWERSRVVRFPRRIHGWQAVQKIAPFGETVSKNPPPFGPARVLTLFPRPVLSSTKSNGKRAS